MATSVEAMLDLWSAALRDVKARLWPLFKHPSVADSAAAFLDGLFGPERRNKTGRMRAEAAGDAGPWRQQAVLGRAVWDADALREMVRDYALETLASPEAVLAIDETAFLKQGKASCGVARQYTGSAGKITNCQIGVFAAYVSGHGHACIDRALYLPKSWTAAPDRLAAARVPDDVPFAPKPALAAKMIEGASATDVPFAWVAADSIYGVGEIEMLLCRAGKGYVLDVTGQHQVWSWGKHPAIAGTAEGIAQALPSSFWQRLSAGNGTKGERFHDWAYLERADLDPAEFGSDTPGLWTRGLLIRRGIVMAAWPFHHLVPGRHEHRDACAGRGHALGDRGRLRERQDRTRPAPQRDPPLVRLAPPRRARHARLRPAGHDSPSRQQHRTAKTARRQQRSPLVRWSVQEIRRVATCLAQRRIEPALVIAWSAWRRTHQAAAQQAHIRRRAQLEC